MTSPLLAPLSDQARLWIYPFERDLQEAELALIIAQVESFTSRWRSHGARVHSAFTLLYRRFALLGGEIPGEMISGCGIDASVRTFKHLRDEHGLDALQHQLIFYRSESSIEAVDRLRFKQLVEQAVVGPETTVFDPTLSTVGELRASLFELPFSRSWHAHAFAARV